MEKAVKHNRIKRITTRNPLILKNFKSTVVARAKTTDFSAVDYLYRARYRIWAVEHALRFISYLPIYL